MTYVFGGWCKWQVFKLFMRDKTDQLERLAGYPNHDHVTHFAGLVQAQVAYKILEGSIYGFDQQQPVEGGRCCSESSGVA